MNSFGTKFRISLFGESHGPAIGVVMDGIPAGVPLAQSDFAADLDRRRSGAAGTTPRRENDRPEILSGLFDGHTTGTPLAVVFRNEDTCPDAYEDVRSHPRPSHADLSAARKFHGYNDYRGGGHFSGRVTLALVAAGVVAKKMLGQAAEISSRIVELGGCRDETQFARIVEKAVAERDSVGGVIECIVDGVPAGLGEPFFDSVESVVSHILFSIPGIKGVEFGAGFNAARMRGSEHNDPIVSVDGRTATNNAGGINGGITNGNHLTVRVAVKPASSIGLTQRTFNMQSGRIEPLTINGRHDTCIALRAAVVLEAAVAIALAQFY